MTKAKIVSLDPRREEMDVVVSQFCDDGWNPVSIASNGARLYVLLVRTQPPVGDVGLNATPASSPEATPTGSSSPV